MTDRPLPLLPREHVRYGLYVDGDQFPVETIERDPGGFGAVSAANFAAAMSRRPETPVVRLYVGERYLATYAHGHWVEPGLMPEIRALGNGAGTVRQIREP